MIGFSKAYVGDDSLYSAPVDGEWGYPFASGSFLFDRTERVGHYHLHRGIDIAAERGRPVLSIVKGVVEHAWSDPDHGFNGYGRVVVIRPLAEHDRNFHILDAHLDRVYVHRGDIVVPGQPVGEVGDSMFEGGILTSHAARPHLHLEISTHAYPVAERREGDPRIDPVPWMVARGITDTVHGQAVYQMVERMLRIHRRRDAQ